jgi:hypothetical protein
MQKTHESGVANHIGPESCGAAREGGVEALTGERAGRVFSRARKGCLTRIKSATMNEARLELN